MGLSLSLSLSLSGDLLLRLHDCGLLDSLLDSSGLLLLLDLGSGLLHGVLHQSSLLDGGCLLGGLLESHLLDCSLIDQILLGRAHLLQGRQSSDLLIEGSWLGSELTCCSDGLAHVLLLDCIGNVDERAHVSIQLLSTLASDRLAEFVGCKQGCIGLITVLNLGDDLACWVEYVRHHRALVDGKFRGT